MFIKNAIEKIGHRYFANHMSRQMKELFFSSVILHFATSAVAIFEPIYLFTLGFDLRGILFFYLFIYILYFFLLPLGGKIARMHGYERSILFSTPFLIIYFLSLFAIKFHYIFIAVAIVSIAIQKILYWPGYHADFAKSGKQKERGREISNFYLLAATVSIIGPAFGGLLITFFGFKTLFVVASVLILFSNIPLLTTPERFKPKPFSYKTALKDVFRKEKRHKFMGYLGFGAEMVEVAVWPIFIYTIVVGYDKIGFLISGSIFIGIISAFFIGRAIDAKKQHLGLIRLGVILTSIIWVIRIIITKTFGIFITDVAHRITRLAVALPMSAVTYNDAQKSSVMRSIIFKEMVLCIGKGGAAILGIIILSFKTMEESWVYLFVLAAVLTLFYSFFRRDDKKDIFLDSQNTEQP